MLLTSYWAIDLIIFSVLLILTYYKYIFGKYDYFEKRNIPFKKPVPFFGSLLPLLSKKTTIGEWFRDMSYSSDTPYFGIFLFNEPCLVIKSPDIIKQVLVKDFGFFADRTVLASDYDEITSNMLFMQKNPDWKKVRAKVSPVFTSGKLKGMLPIINDVGVDFEKYIRKNLGVLDAKEVCSSYSTDVIAKCAFAIHPYSFEEGESEFQKARKALLDFTFRNAFVQSCCMLLPKLANFFKMWFFEKWAVMYIKDVFWNALRERERSQVKGHDLIDLIVQMRKDKDFCDELNFTGDKVVAQPLQFLAAGYDTTSSAISFALYELAMHPEVQEKLRKEILNNIKKHNGVTYDGLMSMKYMDMCLTETLRKYPVLPFLDRKCTEDYHVAGTDLIIEKGMSVFIPVLALHYDENYFPEPEQFDPERFADDSTLNVNGLNYLPFGAGPRNCIGERFALLEAKAAIVRVLSHFELERVETTPTTIKFETNAFLLQSTKGLPMRFKELQQTATF